MQVPAAGRGVAGVTDVADQLSGDHPIADRQTVGEPVEVVVAVLGVGVGPQTPPQPGRPLRDR